MTGVHLFSSAESEPDAGAVQRNVCEHDFLSVAALIDAASAVQAPLTDFKVEHIGSGIFGDRVAIPLLSRGATSALSHPPHPESPSLMQHSTLSPWQRSTWMFL
ncbi:hypothetical protein [Tardiphaga sp.]|uniref:hypothetical protein n=1 Tax=Tardiphaga sp. TaxID=1926292 RepID=UPI0026184F44|nr:hypothetical protein [Tardiphaga sp.]